MTQIHALLFVALPESERPPYRAFIEWTKGRRPRSDVQVEYINILSDGAVTWHDPSLIAPIRQRVLNFKSQTIDAARQTTQRTAQKAARQAAQETEKQTVRHTTNPEGNKYA